MVRIENYLINTKNIQYVYFSEETLSLSIVFNGNDFLVLEADNNATLYMWIDLLKG